MKKKIEILKDIRRQSHDLDPRNEEFDTRFQSLSSEALECMEGVNDVQERKWIEKGMEVISDSDKNAIADGDRDRALSYLKEAVHAVILREDNYRE